MSNQDELCSSPVVQARKIKRSKKKPTVASLPIMLPLSLSLSLSFLPTHAHTQRHHSSKQEWLTRVVLW